MRPVNLIPPEQQRGESAPARAGKLSYVIVGALALILVAVSGYALVSKSVGDKEDQVAELEAREQSAQARADALSPFARFALVEGQRQATVQALARSRFDWERVIRDVALVIPDDVWLVNLTGTVRPDVQIDQSADVKDRDSVEGPALAMVGCGRSHEAVARFTASLRDIDGVTRVTLVKSERPKEKSSAGESNEDECRTRDTVARFEIIAAFDEVAVDPTTGSAVPPAAGDDGGVGETNAERQQANDQAAGQVEEARKAADAIPGA